MFRTVRLPKGLQEEIKQAIADYGESEISAVLGVSAPVLIRPGGR